jgi:tRNA threonylcarbamoyladenosine biosynthesis protein TsaE
MSDSHSVVWTHFVPDESGTLTLGEQLALACQPGTVIFLYGELGAGKTTFSRGFLRGMGYKGKVKSPTYTLVEPYEVQGKMIFHFDFYRLQDPHELEFMGIQDYFSQQAICLIEWPEQGKGLLPMPDLSCYFESSLSGRQMSIKAHSPHGATMLGRFIHGL